MDNAQFVGSLRELAQFYESHQDLPQPSFDVVNVPMDRDSLALIARSIGCSDKDSDGYHFILRKKIGAFTIEFFAPHSEVCERVVVGTKVVPEQTVPSKVIPEHEEEIIEWRCPKTVIQGTATNGTSVQEE